MPPRRKGSYGPRLGTASDPGPESSAPPLTQTKLPVPKKRITVPADRVYKSSTPLTQTKMAVPKKHIRSYGKKTTLRIPKQETLTQMDYLRMSDPIPLDDDADEDPDEIEEADGDYEKQAKKRRNKRRKTAGDESDSASSFHTQRLTQMEWSFTSVPDDEEDLSILDVPGSSQTDLPTFSTLSSRRKMGESSNPNASKARQSPVKEMPPPQTPRRTLATEIPSSQSPATPLSFHTRGSLRRSPLKETSINAPIPFNTGRRPDVSPDKLPKLEIKDTYDTGDTSQFSRVTSSPQKRPSPAKSVRFAPLPDQDEGVEEPDSPSVKRKSTPARKSAMKRTEILDSEAESDEDGDYLLGVYVEEDPVEEAGSPGLENVENNDEVLGVSGSVELGLDFDTENQTPRTEASPELGSDENLRRNSEQESQEAQEPETCYGDIGIETQMEADRIASSSELSSLTSPMTATQPEKDVEDDLEEDQEEGKELEADEEEDREVLHETAIEKTQIMESQRLSTQHVHSMEPRTAESDVFVSIHPSHLTNIITGTKNHEFRNWSLPIHVRRIWIYETQPVSMLKYMAEIGPPKQPGALKDFNGLGNAEFNSKTEKWRAYEILQIYELADPKPLAELKALGWFKVPPTRFARVAPAVIDELIANLLPPLFPERLDHDLAIPASSSTDTQEVDEQIVSTMKQYSQVVGSLRKPLKQAEAKEKEDEEVAVEEDADENVSEEDAEVFPEEGESIPSSPTPQTTPRPRARFTGAAPSQATTVDLSQTQTPMRHSSQAEIIWESPARPVATSTPDTLPSPRHGSIPETQELESHHQFSIPSSQILSKTQLLSDSLLQDSVPGPPPFVMDSDDEDD
ncbi:hypothetical protein WAI453_010067 [Rhynchosporium graminicola]|uniref:Uncharacterized protein n=1 Tax=Rhynchosporium graminicola TaxID=2792576 RepID=A0A1E1KF41_9HELO|nr:uncharacterized protein RCO7_04793 [Rhynchosporium commune]